MLLPTVIAVALSPFFSALISTTMASTPAAAATVTTHTPVMGPNLLSANQLARWYNSVRDGIPPKVPSLHNSITALAQTFVNEGRRDGVRGDIAFVQSILETGWFRSHLTPTTSRASTRSTAARA
jgi:hypothetical protein